MSTHVITVLIADDSKVITQLLCSIFNAEPDIKVIACAKNGKEAVELTQKLKPDLVTMDIRMPVMDGFEATKIIMDQCPTPIIVISSQVNEHELEITFNALQAGALSIIEKPLLHSEEGFYAIKRRLVTAVRALYRVHVMRRKNIHSIEKIPPLPRNKPLKAEILALGSSTGGPGALNSILSSLPAEFPIPIVITQHITKGFLPGLISWLQRYCELPITIAKNNQTLLPGHVYFAGDDHHLIIKKGKYPIAILEDSSPEGNFKPSVTTLFASLAQQYPGTAIGGLLTGMGKDGAQGLLQMKASGCPTFAQSEATSVVFGMPSAAISLNATNKCVDLDKIPQFLATLIYEEGIFP